MLNRDLQQQIKEYCECYHREDGERPCICLFKAECDEIRHTYGTTPDNLEFEQKEGV